MFTKTLPFVGRGYLFYPSNEFLMMVWVYWMMSQISEQFFIHSLFSDVSYVRILVSAFTIEPELVSFCSLFPLVF